MTPHTGSGTPVAIARAAMVRTGQLDLSEQDFSVFMYQMVGPACLYCSLALYVTQTEWYLEDLEQTDEQLEKRRHCDGVPGGSSRQ